MITKTINRISMVIPGIFLCSVIGLLSVVVGRLEQSILGYAWIESLMIAIIVGALLRTQWTPTLHYSPGISFSAKTLLEIAIVLLGASIDLDSLLSRGWSLIVGVVLLVVLGIAISGLINVLLGLSRPMSALIATGTAVCGNSAILAVSPVITAQADDTASAITFTAIVGMLAVIALPVVAHLLDWSPVDAGIFIGLTVYAVPQVLAAAAPLGPQALQIGTVVKLMRVLMLGPTVIVIGLLCRRYCGYTSDAKVSLVPWFIVGFVLMIVARNLNIITASDSAKLAELSGIITILSMSALGLQVDLATLRQKGTKILLAAVCSLMVICAIASVLVFVYKL